MTDLALTPTAIATQPTLDSKLHAFLSFLDVKETTARTYTLGVKSLLAFLKERGLAPTREAVISWRDSVKAACKPSTVKTYLAGVRRFFDWLASMGAMPTSPAKGVKGARLAKGFKKDCLTADQARELLDSVNTNALAGKRDYVMLALMLTCGLRDCEIARARVCDLSTLGGEAVLYVHGKGRDDADAPVKLAPKVEKALRAYLQARGKVDGEAPLLASASNRNAGASAMTTRSISRIVKARLQAIGLDSERLTAHSLRHTTATLNLLNGGTLEETQSLLRHASINTTMLYAHHIEFAGRKAEARIADAIL